VLGRHAGIVHYTIGQRKRLNVGSPVPLYVSGIDAEQNVVTVARKDDPALLRHEVTAEDANLISLNPPPGEASEHIGVTAKIRYNSADQPATLTVVRSGTGYGLKVRFAEPVRAVTPGQSLVCYQGEEVVAGGIITG